GGASFAARGPMNGGGANFAASRGQNFAAAGGRGPGGWHGGGWRHHGGGFWPGVAAGAFVGGALANSYAYYGGPGYYDYGPDYYADNSYYYDDSAPAVEVGVVGGDASYCAQRYRSYDPASGTYLGYDGERHPCP
ncbi:MAG: BA14K family protein, partial [Bradyrhizobium sp.]|uniref:BA14K family protein n=1 Tax=Bradyrhizobium sp. TaxID=376 RepID=UPI003C7A582F